MLTVLIVFLVVTTIVLLFAARGYLALAVVLGIALLGLINVWEQQGVIGWKAAHVCRMALPIALPAIGWIWIIVKFSYWRPRRERKEARELLERKRRERDIAKWNAGPERKERAAQKSKERQQRELALTEYKELANRLEALADNCGQQAVEMQRLEMALHGGDGVRDATRIVMQDAMHIVGTIAFASGAVPDNALRLSYAICKLLYPKQAFWISRKVSSDTRVLDKLEAEHRPASLPLMVALLDAYDKAQNTLLAGQAASAFLSLVRATSQCCSESVAANLVAKRFAELLNNYVLVGTSADGSSSYSRANAGPDNAKPNGHCQQCPTYYPVLGVRADASADAIKQAYKDLVNVWHPDRFEHNEGLRQRAEERFKDIQQAYNHVMTHFEKARA